MYKVVSIIFLLLFSIGASAQIQSIPKVEVTREVNKNLKPNGDFDLFQNLSHPLAITGGIIVLGGAATYIIGSETNNSNYQPVTTTQYVGISLFAAGAVLFTVFSAEWNESVVKRKKSKKKYDASDWETQ
tara:strand:- start:156 stop:545 length:390 start_codon:yes stop_codon:yes gene_type:complete